MFKMRKQATFHEADTEQLQKKLEDKKAKGIEVQALRGVGSPTSGGVFSMEERFRFNLSTKIQ